MRSLRLQIVDTLRWRFPRPDDVAFGHDISLALDLASSFNAELFPFVESFECIIDGSVSARAVSRIMPPTLKYITFDVIAPVEDIGSCFQKLCSSSGLIQLHCVRLWPPDGFDEYNPNITVYARQDARALAQHILDSIPHFTQLRSLKIEPMFLVFPPLWTAIRSLLLLKSILLTWDGADTPDSMKSVGEIGFGDGFHHLEELEIELVLALAEPLLASKPDNIQRLRLGIIEDELRFDSPSYSHLLRTLGSVWQDLTSLELHFTDMRLIWSRVMCEALFPLKNLRRFLVWTESVSSINDDDYGEVGRAFPHLETLSISPDPLEVLATPKATLGSLCQLAQHCLKLEHLSCFLDLNLSVNAANGQPAFKNLGSLNLGMSRLTNDNYPTTAILLTHVTGSNTRIIGGVNLDRRPVRPADEDLRPRSIQIQIRCDKLETAMLKLRLGEVPWGSETPEPENGEEVASREE